MDLARAGVMSNGAGMGGDDSQPRSGSYAVSWPFFLQPLAFPFTFSPLPRGLSPGAARPAVATFPGAVVVELG